MNPKRGGGRVARSRHRGRYGTDEASQLFPGPGNRGNEVARRPEREQRVRGAFEHSGQAVGAGEDELAVEVEIEKAGSQVAAREIDAPDVLGNRLPGR